MPTYMGRLDPLLDIKGAEDSVNNRNLVDEQNERGAKDGATATGNGTSDNVTAPDGDGVQTATVASAAFSASQVHKFLTVAGMANAVNNGTFLIVARTATTISYVNAAGVVEASITATFDVYAPYSLDDDISFTQTDRKNIKGTAQHYTDVPTYQRPTAVGTNVPANLTNIAGKTTDGLAFTLTRKYENATVAQGNAVLTMTDTGNLPHADATDTTGVPIQDGADSANLSDCYADIIDPASGDSLTVIGKAVGTINCDNAGSAVIPADGETVVINDGTNPAVTFEFDTNASVVETATLRRVNIATATTDNDVRDALISAINGAPTLNIVAENGGAGIVKLTNSVPGTAGNQTITETVTGASFVVSGMSGGTANAGNRIFGMTQAGSSTEPNSVEVKFYHLAHGAPLSVANAYTWERDQPTTVDVFYGFRQRLDQLDRAAFRTTMVNGIVGDAGQALDIAEIRQAIGIADGDNDLDGFLTNLSSFYPFSELDNTPTVTEALNKLNEEIGNRDYTGTLLTDGQTITASLQALSNAISAASLTRVIERVSVTIPKDTVHTLPGGNTYTPDGSNNGANMYVFWRKLLRDPGPSLITSNDYAETSGTSITPYEKINAGESINYMILQ